MKNIKIISFIISIIGFISCNDQISIYGDLREKTSLNCIINDDDMIQTAIVTSSYMGDTNQPQFLLEDNSLKGVEITIAFEDSAIIMNEMTIPDFTSEYYNGPITYYYHDNLNIIPERQFFISALLPDGRRLTSNTTAPSLVEFLTVSDTLIPPVGRDLVSVYWNHPPQQQYVSSVFKVYYFKVENGVDVRYEKKIPLEYYLQDNEYVPYYPEPSNHSMISVGMDSFSRALSEISEGDPVKENYKILAFILEIRVYDKYLTSYYASQVEYLDDFSIKVDQPDFSNINGGYGIFGCYIKQRKSIKFSHDYIRSFGYIPALTD